MIPGALDDLGHHGRRSRVTWYPGSTPPYSSLWITIQRFLMLNQPSRVAFAQDFLLRAVHASPMALAFSPPRSSINAYHVALAQSPVRLTRFARVLKEPSETFRCCHIGQFSDLVRPYFGEFTVCPDCLGEGFHSVLYAFNGIRACPVHGTTLESLSHRSQLPGDLFQSALRNPFGRCQYLQQILQFPAARTPAAHAQRDLVLGEIADWLMDIGSRCWLGQYGVRQTVPFDAFARRYGALRQILNVHHATPGWEHGPLVHPASTSAVATMGRVKVRANELVEIDDKHARGQQTDLNLYGQTLLVDFKAVQRHVQSSALGRHGRHWLARLAHATDPEDVQTLLNQGGATARRAWLFLAWSRQLRQHDFNPNAGLHTRALQFAVSWDIPLWIGRPKRGLPPPPAHDFVRLWVARWISAAGLLAFWQRTSVVPDRDIVEHNNCDTAVWAPFHW